MKDEPSTVRHSILAPPLGVDTPSVVSPRDFAKEDVLLGALSGVEPRIGGVRVRAFTLADYAMLRRAGNHYTCIAEKQVDASMLEHMMLAVYVLDASRSLDAIMEIVYENEREEVLKMAVLEMGKKLDPRLDLAKLDKGINDFLTESRATRTQVEPDKKSKSKKKPASSLRGGSSSSPTPARKAD